MKFLAIALLIAGAAQAQNPAPVEKANPIETPFKPAEPVAPSVIFEGVVQSRLQLGNAFTAGSSGLVGATVVSFSDAPVLYIPNYCGYGFNQDGFYLFAGYDGENIDLGGARNILYFFNTNNCNIALRAITSTRVGDRVRITKNTLTINDREYKISGLENR